jgi:hypothetical protein
LEGARKIVFGLHLHASWKKMAISPSQSWDIHRVQHEEATEKSNSQEKKKTTPQEKMNSRRTQQQEEEPH